MRSRNNKVYAVYKGDEFICLGTYKEISEYLGVGIRTLHSYKAKPYRYNYIIIEIGKVDDNLE